MSAVDSFWSIPPIQDALALHLERIDFWNCIQVSKSLHDAFIPHLWKVIKGRTIHGLSHFLKSPGQPRFGHYLKVLHLREHEIPPWYRHYSTCGTFPNLNKIDLVTSSNAHMDEFIALAVRHVASLEYLQLYFTRDLKEFWDGLSTFCSRLTHLRDLTLMLSHAISFQTLVRILESGANIHYLKLLFWNSLRGDSEPITKAKFQSTKIRQLVLCLDGQRVDPGINRFLAFCPDLEKLVWPTTTEAEEAAEDIGVVLAAHCPKLKELCLSKSGEGSEDLDCVLNRCARLTKLSLRVPILYNSVLQAIISRHSIGLKNLDLSTGKALMVDDLFMVANTCLHLKRLVGQVQWGLETRAFRDTLTRLKAQPWGFKGLERLKLVFIWQYFPKKNDVYEELESKVEADAAVMDALYCQIGRLNLLQDLDLRMYHMAGGFADAFMKGMDHLAGLQWLRRFYFSDCVSYPLRREEIKMVVRSWKRLKAFGGLSGEWLEFSPEVVVCKIRALLQE